MASNMRAKAGRKVKGKERVPKSESRQEDVRRGEEKGSKIRVKAESSQIKDKAGRYPLPYFRSLPGHAPFCHDFAFQEAPGGLAGAVDFVGKFPSVFVFMLSVKGFCFFCLQSGEAGSISSRSTTSKISWAAASHEPSRHWTWR